MSVEQFLLLCKMRKWHFTYSWIKKRLDYLESTLSPEMKDYLNRSGHEPESQTRPTR